MGSGYRFSLWLNGMVVLMLFVVLPQHQAMAAEGLYIHQIAIHPQKPEILYAATDNQGVLKSLDGGKRWSLINHGIKSYLLYQIALHPQKPEMLYVGSWGGGVYSSVDGGNSWSEENRGLENTAIGTLILTSPEEETLYVATSSGVYQGKQGGKSWSPLNTGLSLGNEEWPQCLLLLPSQPTTLYLGTNQGLYRWMAAQWARIEGTPFKHVTALAYNPQSRSLYVGTLGEGIHRSADAGQNWMALGAEKLWIDQIVIHPIRPQTLFAMTRDRGILKSVNGGRSWGEANDGITDQWVTTISFDPKNPATLYAGTHEEGIFKSTNEGRTWKALLQRALQSPDERNVALAPTADPASNQGKAFTSPPPAFKKCNECHGWTDARLNSHSPTYYRMAASRRDWTGTVQRMSRRAQLTPAEEAEILQYLNRYYGITEAMKTDDDVDR